MRPHAHQVAARLSLSAGVAVCALAGVALMGLPLLLLSVPPIETPAVPARVIPPQAPTSADTAGALPPEDEAEPAPALPPPERPVMKPGSAAGLTPQEPAAAPPQGPDPSRAAAEVQRAKHLHPQPAHDTRADRSSAGRARRVERFGGTPATENAVEAGLGWLAAHQDARGTWNREAFHHHCPPNDRCGGIADRRTINDLTSGTTALCLLAFLGAGYTDHDGPYQDTVARALAALLARQQSHGGFSVDESMAGYNDALATFALAEYYDLTRERRVVAPLERAVARLARSQQVLGGWDYLPRSDAGRNDTSITGWVVQALRAAHNTGVRVPPGVLARSALHFVHMTEPDGSVRYSDAGIGTRLISARRLEYRHGPAMLSVGLMSHQLLGWRSDSDTVRRQAAMLLEALPSTAMARGRDSTDLHSEYHWYYGTIAAFQVGGSVWDRWNGALRDALLPLQERGVTASGARRHAYGSWTPYGQDWGRWGRMGGRVYTTAICVLTLEVYYRHTPAYLDPRPTLIHADWVRFIQDASPTHRAAALRALAEMVWEVSEPALLELLRSDSRDIAVPAAIALAGIGSPMGEPVLLAALDSSPASQRLAALEALRRIEQDRALPPSSGALRVVDADAGLATLDLPRAFAGQTLVVRRVGLEVARLRVAQRFSGESVVLAEILTAPAEAPLREGEIATPDNHRSGGAP